MQASIRSLFQQSCAIATVFTLGSCATMFDGTSQDVTFSSPQANSKVIVEGQTYNLPATTKISKKTTTATFTNKKYPSKELAWKRKFQWGYLALDVLFTPGWGTVGCITDGVTNAWMKHPPVITYDFMNKSTNVTEVAAPATTPKP